VAGRSTDTLVVLEICAVVIPVVLFTGGCVWKLSNRLSYQDYLLKWIQEEILDIKKRVKDIEKQ